MTFNELIAILVSIRNDYAIRAVKAINLQLTIRNWLIGLYIFEYEQKGKDRASYGEQLLESIAANVSDSNPNPFQARDLRRFRQFYLAYPQIRQSLTAESLKYLPVFPPILSGSHLSDEYQLSGSTILENLSFTHLVELIQIGDPIRRHFYEMECIKGQWSVRELKRQIHSLLFERCGLSKEKGKLLKTAQDSIVHSSPRTIIRDPYVFEFLGLKPCEVLSENRLESKLHDRLTDFLLELGHGFCFEARQKRILIGEEYYFIDLVFYHRILKCHVIIDLKVDSFKHEYLGQLNTYLNWYRRHVMAPSDNLPVGMLLCTHKDDVLIEYATLNMDNNLFVSKYQLQLPDKDQLKQFIHQQFDEDNEPND